MLKLIWCVHKNNVKPINSVSEGDSKMGDQIWEQLKK